jgi:ABC-type glycerol-3-phosphate transport system substrate-binding protein
MTRFDFPKTWNDLRKMSEQFTTWDGDTLKTVGFLPTTLDMVQLHVWSALNGSQFYDSVAQKHTIDAEQNVEMMSYLLDWFNEEYKGDLTAVSTSDNWGFYPDGNGRPAAFTQGHMAMASDGFWVAGDMYGGQEVNDVANTWDVAQYPVGPSGSSTKSGYWPNWVVLPKGARRRDEGFKYIDYLVVDGMKTWFEAVPDFPANKKVDTSGFLPQVVAEQRSPEFARDVMTFFSAQLGVATPMWNSPVQNFANDQITRMIEQVFTKSRPPREALAEAQKAAQTELEKVLRGG